MKKLMMISILFFTALFNLVYGMSGNVLWVEKNYTGKIYVYSNASTTSALINPGESYVVEYDVYLADYSLNGRYDNVVLIDVSLNVQNAGYNVLYFITIDGNGDNNGLDLETNMQNTGNIYNYKINDFLKHIRHIKMVITKINDTSFRVEGYIDNVLIGYKNGTGNLTKINHFLLGSTATNVAFKMAVDDIKVKLPNGTVIFEDFEDDDWGKVIYNSRNKHYIRGEANYSVASFIQPLKAPIPLEVVVFILIIIPAVALRIKQQ